MVITPHSIQEATIIYRNHSSHTSFYTRGYNHIQKSFLSHLFLYKRLQSYTVITPLTPHSIQEATIIYRNHSSHTSFYTKGYNHIQKSFLSHLILYKRLQSYTVITPFTPHSIQEATIIYRNHSSHISFYTRGYNHIQKSLLSHLILYKRLQSYTEITPLTPHSIQEATIIYRNHSSHTSFYTRGYNHIQKLLSHTSFYTRGYNHIQKSPLSHLILYKRLQSYTEITPLTPHSIQEATIIYRNHSSHTSFYTRGYNHIQKSLLSHLILYT